MPSIFVILFTTDGGESWSIYGDVHFSRDSAESEVEESDTCKIVEYVPKEGG